MPNGVPNSWMAAFYPGTEIYAVEGKGCHFTDVDGNRYLDMSQCDLSMVCGFGPEAVTRAVADRFGRGSHFLLPTEDAIAVCMLLAERFGMPFWQFTLSASTANTEAIRIAASPPGGTRCWCSTASITAISTRHWSRQSAAITRLTTTACRAMSRRAR